MSSSRPSIGDKRKSFHRLHDSGCFVIPNPWDVGSALYLQQLGFKALASTSSGLAWSLGRADNSISLDMALTHLAALVEATDIPVNADFENGFAHDPDGVARNVALAVQAGVAGLSIEDSTGDAGRPLYEEDQAVARMRAARKAIDANGGDALLVGRAECFLVGKPDIQFAITRLKAYANAGADCLYAPGVRTPEHISALVAALAPKPINLLMGWAGGLGVSDIAALGVRRISVGGALARCAWSGFAQAATQLAKEGRFDALAQGAGAGNLDALFGQPRR
jgi:2-methylisocitrate lyase-like PEP mutase family enzyme